MKKTILFVLFLSCGYLSYSQENSKTSISKEVLNYAKSNGSYIVDTPQEKMSSISYDGEISLVKAKLIDPSKMGISITNKNLVYKITGTNQLLIVKSVWVLENELKNASHEKN